MLNRSFHSKIYLLILVAALGFGTSLSAQKDRSERASLASAIESSYRRQLLDCWYPRSIDSLYGGFISAWEYDFTPARNQDKMIVSQARHVWSNAIAMRLYPDEPHFRFGAQQGFVFLREKMWDKVYGGFFTLVDRRGVPRDSVMKVTYGNAFGIYACAAWYKSSGDTSALHLARECFLWLEKNAHDSIYRGYFQHLDRKGEPIKRTAATPSTSDLGYKDQNSSIHVLEAFTELYEVWPDSLLRVRLEEMLEIVRDVITDHRGSLTLFLRPDWTPVSFRDSSKASILKHRHLDHISFGHDIETAYLLLEASHILGRKNDTRTMTVAKKMVDHCLQNGWDSNNGGIYDEGYYFLDTPRISIIKRSKNWWAQAEALNTLLIMDELYPDDPMHYYSRFRKQWNYIDRYLIDHRYGDWFDEGLDNSPQRKTAMKGHIWKATYHQLRALTNCVKRLRTSASAGN